jgi:hypothetical protein
MGATLLIASCRKSGTGVPARAEAWHVAQGVAPFLMRGKVRTLRGSIGVVRADLDVDFSDVTKTRGSISFDLASLKMTSFEDVTKNDLQTSRAFSWLHLVEDGDRFRWATYLIRGIESAEPKDLASASGSQRRTRITATGDLSLNGRTAPCRAVLEANVAFEGTRGRAMHLRTVDDIALSLAPYDVIPPRDRRGADFNEADDLVLETLDGTADVALDLALEPAPR